MTHYDAYGGIASSTGQSENNRLANTKERSFTLGLDNHGMRYFDPEVGRYITRDPIGYGDGLNVYLYVHNNPINHIDPHGLAAVEVEVGPEFKRGPLKLQVTVKIDSDGEIQRGNGVLTLQPEFLKPAKVAKLDLKPDTSFTKLKLELWQPLETAFKLVEDPKSITREDVQKTVEAVSKVSFKGTDVDKGEVQVKTPVGKAKINVWEWPVFRDIKRKMDQSNEGNR
jgi:RHS repeat-associated protein